jgi:hypothetical protein
MLFAADCLVRCLSLSGDALRYRVAFADVKLTDRLLIRLDDVQRLHLRNWIFIRSRASEVFSSITLSTVLLLTCRHVKLSKVRTETGLDRLQVA